MTCFRNIQVHNIKNSIKHIDRGASDLAKTLLKIIQDRMEWAPKTKKDVTDDSNGQVSNRYLMILEN